MSDIPTGASVDVAEGWVRSWSASVSDRAARAQSLSDQVSRLSATVADRNELVSGTVDSAGVMKDLRLAADAGQLTMDRLAETIMRAP